jgi:hypothetical protein
MHHTVRVAGGGELRLRQQQRRDFSGPDIVIIYGQAINDEPDGVFVVVVVVIVDRQGIHDA